MARQINLALVGIIILSSIRLVLRGVTRVRIVVSYRRPFQSHDDIYRP